MTEPVQASPPGDDGRAEARAAEVQAIARELRCLVCQNESIAESRSALAQDLRRWLHHRLDAGASREQVLDELVLRYGEFIRYSPPVDARTLPLWGAPGLLVGGGALALALVIRRRQRLADEPEVDLDADLQPRGAVACQPRTLPPG